MSIQAKDFSIEITSNKSIENISDEEIVRMMDDTSQLIAKHKVDHLSSAAIAAHNSNALSNEVEFWKWLGRNYEASGIFDTNVSMQEYISQSAGKEEWFAKQIQGKGYEWDWMTSQRGDVTKAFKTYDAGDVVNRAGSDVTEHNLFTGKDIEYQMKAYTGKTNPHLKNTPKDMTVVTNAEKVDVVRGNGYNNVDEFQDAKAIQEARDARMDQVKNGKVQTSYGFANVAGMMVKAGLIGCAIGIGFEAIASYKAWKNGQLSDKEYLSEILKAGGSTGVTSGLTAGVMLPVSVAVTAVGASTLLTIPVAFIVGDAINKIVAPCFGLGKYREILSKAKYYQNIDSIYSSLLESMRASSEQYLEFVQYISTQNAIHNEIRRQNVRLNEDLKELYDSI